MKKKKQMRVKMNKKREKISIQDKTRLNRFLELFAKTILLEAGFFIIIVLIFWGVIAVAQSQESTEEELARLGQELIDAGYSWLTNYSGEDLYTKIEVYEKDKNEKIADFGTISDETTYKILLTNLDGSYDDQTEILTRKIVECNGIDNNYDNKENKEGEKIQVPQRQEHSFTGYVNCNSTYINVSVDGNFGVESAMVAHWQEQLPDKRCTSPVSGFESRPGRPQSRKCYIEEWKLFKDLNGDDEVITLNQETGKKEWQNPLGKEELKHEGEMYRIMLEGNNELVVSPKHKVYVKADYEKEFELIKVTKVYELVKNSRNVYFLNADDLVFLDANNNPVKVKNIEKVPYKGKIYDVDVENDIVLVRRWGEGRYRIEVDEENFVVDEENFVVDKDYMIGVEKENKRGSSRMAEPSRLIHNDYYDWKYLNVSDKKIKMRLLIWPLMRNWKRINSSRT